MELSEIFGALTYEASRSPDVSSQNAACLLDNDWNLKAIAHNRFPDGIEVSEARLSHRNTKLMLMEHAESACVTLAARNGVSTDGLTMACLWASCPACARTIISAGVRTVITSQVLHDATPERWVSTVRFGLHMLAEAGVRVAYYSGRVDPMTPFLFDGQFVSVNEDAE